MTSPIYDQLAAIHNWNTNNRRARDDYYQRTRQNYHPSQLAGVRPQPEDRTDKKAQT